MSKFVSKKAEFRLIIRPSDRIIDESRRPVLIPGERVEFHNHTYTTKDEGLIEYLVNHPLHNRAFTIAEGTPVQKKRALEFGARSTVVTPGAQSGQLNLEDAKKRYNKVPEEIEVKANEASTENPVTREEIGSMIDRKLDDFFFQMKNLLKKDSEIPEPSESMKALGIPVPNTKTDKKARVFTCNQCNKTFTSGFAVGLHKREEHK